MVSILLCRSRRKQLPGNQACQQQVVAAIVLLFSTTLVWEGIVVFDFSSETCIWMPRKNIKR
jgi:hypothetical protein